MTPREATRLAILSSLEGDTQVGVPITVPRRAAWIEDIKRWLRQAAEARHQGDFGEAASLLRRVGQHRRLITDTPVMCAIGDGRVVRGTVGQRPPQAWRDAYFAQRAAR